MGGPIFFFFFFFRTKRMGFERRALYAFLDGIEARSLKRSSRISFVFDCYDADRLDAAKGRAQILREHSAFARVRALTTIGKFSVLTGIERLPEEGGWFLLEVGANKAGNGVPAWHCQFDGNIYETPTTGYLNSIQQIDGFGRRPSSLSAAVPAPPISAKALSKIFALPPIASRGKEITKVLKAISQAETVVVHDVGQANLNTLRDKHRNSLLMYDAGFPAPFNRHTIRRKPSFQLPESVPILLSHWDWDHLAMGLHQPKLKNNLWIAPYQLVGPGAFRFATELRKNKRLAYWPYKKPKSFAFGTVFKCSGPAIDRNNSGLVLLSRLKSGSTVLHPGDADYDRIIDGAHTTTKSVDRLIASHHGGKLNSNAGAIPVATSTGELAVSYGARNVYGHPTKQSLSEHGAKGWNFVKRTARHKASPRGPITLGP